MPATSKAALRRPLFAALELLWLAFFSAAGLGLRPRIARIKFSGADRVLVISTHPDDELSGCGRAIALHRGAGDRVIVVAVTDGRRSGALGLTPFEMAARRSREFEAAMSELGVEGRQLRLPEGTWQPDELASQLEGLVADFRPTLVYAQSIVDYHPEHVKVARAVAPLLSRADAELRVRIFQVHVPLTPVLADAAVVTSDRLIAATLARAEARYVTQASSLRRVHRLAAQAGAFWRTGAPAEVFWTLSAGDYARVQGDAPEAKYRGLRERPLSDGLAWLVGLRDRRRLSLAAARARAAPGQRRSTR